VNPCICDGEEFGVYCCCDLREDLYEEYCIVADCDKHYCDEHPHEYHPCRCDGDYTCPCWLNYAVVCYDAV
jgi:hypothetical protein